MTRCLFVVLVQAIQEVFTVLEWVKDARNEARLVDNLRVKTSKSLIAAESRNKELALKLATTDRDQRSVKAGLRTAEAQVEEQGQNIHYTEIELATAKQQGGVVKGQGGYLGGSHSPSQVQGLSPDLEAIIPIDPSQLIS